MRFWLISIVLVSCAVPAFAQSVGSDDRRFTFHKVDDGFLRLDGRTGAVSLCTRPDSGWTCRVVPDERTALEGEIARLGSENATLKQALVDRGPPLPGLPPRPPANIGVDRAVPGDAELDRVVAFVGKVWRRTLQVIANVQRDLADRL
jgi:hypothetical protein